MPNSFLELVPTAFSEPRGGAPLFRDQLCLGKFQITKERTCVSEDVEIPNLVSDSAMRSAIGAYLGTDYASAVLLRYKAYQELKHKYFLQWIINNEYFTKVQAGEYKKPDFVCFDGRLTDTMMTPWITRFGDWELYAAKMHDCIYLWTDKHAALAHSVESYYGVYFEHLLTHEDPTESAPNEYDKVNLVGEVSFGPHQFLCLHEIDAIIDSGDMVELKVYRKTSPVALGARQLRCWARCIVPGVNKVIVGQRDDNGHLAHIESTPIDALTAKYDWKPGPCYEFQNRLLTWIKSHFDGNAHNVVKKFLWASGSSRVYSSEVPESYVPKAFLPKWYLSALETE